VFLSSSGGMLFVGGNNTESDFVMTKALLEESNGESAWFVGQILPPGLIVVADLVSLFLDATLHVRRSSGGCVERAG